MHRRRSPVRGKRRVLHASGELPRSVRLVLEMTPGRIDSMLVGRPQLRGNDFLDFRNGDNWQLLDEQQEPHREPAETPDQDRVIDERRAITRPLPRLEFM